MKVNGKRKILLVRSTPNDIDINAYNVQQVGLGKAFCELGFDYDFITLKKDAPRKEFVFYEKNGCRAKCIEKPRKRFFRWGINTEIADAQFLAQYDLIICQEYYQLESYLIARKSDKVVLYSGPYYNMFMPKLLSPIYDMVFTKKIDEKVKSILVKSQLAFDFLHNKGYTKLHNIGVALDASRFENETQIKPETQKVIDYMKEHKCILYVGALSDRKNYPFLLEVYQYALKYVPDLKFVMIGKSRVSAMAKLAGKKDDDYAAKFYDKLPQNVKDGIYHIERIDNPQLKFIYPLAKAFLLPSKLEIFGMVLLEAMYLRTPVITSLNGGSMTLIQGKETGLIVEQFDKDLWCQAIIKYLDNPECTNEVTERAYKLIRDEYNWTVLAKKMLNIAGIDC
ncbi:MAG: glycosyltransferase family 4 protein [Elusimicrobiales bacterium]|nr:glycosyltransferase family 4 protein [Elusimicrobiales bacterium]